MLYRTVQSAVGYDKVGLIRLTWEIGCRQQLYIQNCGQTAAERKLCVTIDSL